MSDTAPHIPAFSRDADADFEIRGALGHSVAGAGEPGEILAAVAGLHPHDHEAWFSAWSGLAERVSAIAATAASAGHDVSAAQAYLRASAYAAVAVNAASSLPDAEAGTRLAGAFSAQQAAWSGFIRHTDVAVQEVRIPYEQGTLPGWFFRSSGEATATLVAVNGSDGSLAALWASAAAPALARGYDVLLFDGPGQQSQLFEQRTFFRPDWEHVLTPVFNFLAGLERVDAGRIAVYGISQGGYWVARALTAEHRFVAAITDPGVVDVSTSWTDHLPHHLLSLLAHGRDDAFDSEMEMGMRFSPALARTWRFRARPFGRPGYAATIRAVQDYTVTDAAARITTPLLILSPENEQFWPGQAEQLAALTPDVSTLIRFTAAEGADGHCQPLARTLTAQRMFDWLDERVAE